jgi:hypothetical protein
LVVVVNLFGISGIQASKDDVTRERSIWRLQDPRSRDPKLEKNFKNVSSNKVSRNQWFEFSKNQGFREYDDGERVY